MLLGRVGRGIPKLVLAYPNEILPHAHHSKICLALWLAYPYENS